MTETTKPPRYQRNRWVDIAGGLFVTCGFLIMLSRVNEIRPEEALSIRQLALLGSLSFALLFVLGGLATIRRSRGWRVWYGALAWGTIVAVGLASVPLMHLSSSGEPTPNEVLIPFVMFGIVITAVAVLALLAKRRERPST
jgi:UDP-N-acetylmuramyl pentapeptide phosphotransferase/UDP-N-acetylglucosamine-1-phosphate transferase